MVTSAAGRGGFGGSRVACAALPPAAATALAHVGPAAVVVAQSMVQYHGGIGYTWEHAHLYYRRAKSDQLLLGLPAALRARHADLLGSSGLGGAAAGRRDGPPAAVGALAVDGAGLGSRRACR